MVVYSFSSNRFPLFVPWPAAKKASGLIWLDSRLKTATSCAFFDFSEYELDRKSIKDRLETLGDTP